MLVQETKSMSLILLRVRKYSLLTAIDLSNMRLGPFDRDLGVDLNFCVSDHSTKKSTSAHSFHHLYSDHLIFFAMYACNPLKQRQ